MNIKTLIPVGRKRNSLLGWLAAAYGAAIVGNSGILLGLEEKENETNLYKQGDMETSCVTNGVALPAGWFILNGKAALSAEKDTVESGKQSLKITVSYESDTTWVRSDSIQVKPGASYELSASTYVHALSPAAPWAGFQVYESEGGWNPGDGRYLILSSEQGKWERKKATFLTRAGTKWLRIGILVGEKNGGSICVDNVALREVE
ncbi:MAG: hypothetical protein HY360_03025 [Verrucomicrobia bacterium]|nr:hypothetical protein [Verrucomicrobiota bacterium]